MSDKKYYPAVDIFKFLFSICVLTIHFSPFSSVNFWLDRLCCLYFTRLAVPFYFLCSGFFLFRKVDIYDVDFSIVKKYAIKILKFYLIWTAIYTPVFVYDSFMYGSGSFSQELIKFIQKFFFSDIATQLWYLNTAFSSVLLVGLLLKKKVSLNKIIIFSSILYIIGIFGQSYGGLLHLYEPLYKIFESYRSCFLTTRNTVFEGLLFISLGAWFSHNKIKFNIKKYISLFMVSMFLWFLEICAVVHFEWQIATDTYLFLVPSVVFLFIITLNINIAPKPIYHDLATVGFLSYLNHMLVLKVVDIVASCFGYVGQFEFLRQHSLLRSLIAFVLSYLLAYLTYFLSTKKNCTLLKRIYT